MEAWWNPLSLRFPAPPKAPDAALDSVPYATLATAPFMKARRKIADLLAAICELVGLGRGSMMTLNRSDLLVQCGI